MIKDVLRGLGMTHNEIEIYLVLLNGRDMGVNKIASESCLHRQVCYDALDRLVDKGFVTYAVKSGKKLFKALEPEKILDYLEGKKQEVESVLPKLTGMFMKEKGETDVDLLKGKNVIRSMYNDILRTLSETGDTMCAMGIDENKFLAFDEDTIRGYILKMTRSNFREKLLTKKGTAFFFEGTQSEYRLLPRKAFSANPTTHMYGTKTAIIIWGNPVYGVIIDNEQVTETNRRFFRMLWNTATPRKI